MTNRALIILAVLALLALGCKKDEPAPRPLGEAPPTTAEGAPTPMGAAPPATAEAAPGEAADDGPKFEGEIDLRITSAEKKEKASPLMTLKVKGKKFRFAMPEGMEGAGPQLGAKGYVVLDGREKKIMAVSDEKRQVVLLPLDKLGAQLGKLSGDPAAEAKPGAEPKPNAKKPPELKKTGKTDTVAGRSCEEWELTNEDKSKMLLCVAAERASWLELPTLGLPTEHAWAHELVDGKHLPLRAIMLEPSGKEKMRVELVRLEEKALDDALFAPPADYKVLDMGEMMNGMAQMLGGATPPGAGGQTQGALPPGMAGKMPPNFQAMMARMREQMQAMKAKQGAPGAQGAQGPSGARADETAKLAAPAAEPKSAKALAKAKAKLKAGESAPTKPAE
jgi:hypothetical protein